MTPSIVQGKGSHKKMRNEENIRLLCNPMDYSPPGSSVHGNSPGKNTRVGSHSVL